MKKKKLGKKQKEKTPKYILRYGFEGDGFRSGKHTTNIIGLEDYIRRLDKGIIKDIEMDENKNTIPADGRIIEKINEPEIWEYIKNMADCYKYPPELLRLNKNTIAMNTGDKYEIGDTIAVRGHAHKTFTIENINQGVFSVINKETGNGEVFLNSNDFIHVKKVKMNPFKVGDLVYIDGARTKTWQVIAVDGYLCNLQNRGWVSSGYLNLAQTDAAQTDFKVDDKVAFGAAGLEYTINRIDEKQGLYHIISPEDQYEHWVKAELIKHIKMDNLNEAQKARYSQTIAPDQWVKLFVESEFTTKVQMYRVIREQMRNAIDIEGKLTNERASLIKELSDTLK